MPFPIIIKLKPELIYEFAECELGAHEDGEQVTETENLSAYTILMRNYKKGKIEIRNAEEADMIYYAAASGTFGLMGEGMDDEEDDRQAYQNRIANRICDKLRQYATVETVNRWPCANGF